MKEIIIALITSGFALAGVISTNIISLKKINKDITNKLDTQQEVFKIQLAELTREVRHHNNFAERIPKLEAEVENIKEFIQNK